MAGLTLTLPKNGVGLEYSEELDDGKVVISGFVKAENKSSNSIFKQSERTIRRGMLRVFKERTQVLESQVHSTGTSYFRINKKRIGKLLLTFENDNVEGKKEVSFNGKTISNIVIKVNKIRKSSSSSV